MGMDICSFYKQPCRRYFSTVIIYVLTFCSELSLRTANPFPLESVCQHDSGEVLISLFNSKSGDNLTARQNGHKYSIRHRQNSR